MDFEYMKKFTFFTCLFLLQVGFLFSQVGDSSRLTIVFAGDMMGHGPQYYAAYDSLTGDYNYGPCFKFIKPFIDSADIAIANFEVTLGNKPYTGYPTFSSPDGLARDIRNAGFDILALANNHCYDRGKKGLYRTLSKLDSLNIQHLGEYRDSAERSKHYPFIIEKKGFRIAFFNYTYGTNGIVTEKPNIVNYIDKKIILSDLAKADSMKVDYKIAIMHWGKEYEPKPSKEQTDVARYMANHGCNAIIGSHPHVVETFEVLHPDTADSSQIVPVFYSMGNFFSNQRNRYRDGGAMFSLTLEKKDKTTAIRYSYLPYWVFRGTLNNKYQFYVIPTAYYYCNSDSLKLPEEDKSKLKEFDSDIHLQLSNLKESNFFKCDTLNGNRKPEPGDPMKKPENRIQ
jgi:poly-gamma-glutamate synthesis protein (capsule biosynthesis protein)